MQTVILALTVSFFLSGFNAAAQDAAKTMEKGAKNAYKILLEQTDKNKDGY